MLCRNSIPLRKMLLRMAGRDTFRYKLKCVLLAVWSRAGRSRVRVLVRARNFYVVQKFESGSGYRDF